jgi:4-hydroxybenzoate-CoA ligase
VPVDIPNTFNVADYLISRHVREGRGGRVAVRHEAGVLTYAGLDELARRTASALRGLGLTPGQRVVLVLPDVPAFYAAFLGAIMAGLVPVPTSTLLRRADHQYVLTDSHAAAVIVHETLVGDVLSIAYLEPDLRHILVVGAAHGRLTSFDAIVDAAAPLDAVAPTHRDDAAFWLYSSGSTGAPKAVIHLQHDIVWTVEGYARETLGMTDADRVLSAAKLFFAYGLGNSLSFPLALGGEAAVVAKRLGPDATFEAIDRYKPTIFFGVPTLFGGMLQVEGAETRFDLSSLRFCVSAGEALPPEIFRRWRDRFGLEIVDGIGSTELLHIFISNRPGAARPGSTGIEVPGYRARIVDEAGRDTPDGEIGNLLVSGDSAGAGYWQQDEKTKATFEGAWVHTGDKYIRTADGFFEYCGRRDDMLKVAGIWVSPIEVENTILTHPQVAECAVVGAADADGLIKPRAFVVLRPGIEPTHLLRREIQSFVRARIAAYKYPRWVEFVEELPKTATGKIQRFRLRPLMLTTDYTDGSGHR